MTVGPAKTAKPIEMQFGLWTWVGPRNHVYGAPDLPCKEAILRGKETDEWCGPKEHVLHGGLGPSKAPCASAILRAHCKV